MTCRQSELDRLEDMLVHEGIEFIRKEKQLYSPYWFKGAGWSVVCHGFSYGGAMGLLEFWDGNDEPTGYLKAEEAFAMIEDAVK